MEETLPSTFLKKVKSASSKKILIDIQIKYFIESFLVFKKFLLYFVFSLIISKGFSQVYTDNATSYGGTWSNGSNNSTPSGGFGAWSITAGANSGVFIGNPANNGMGTANIGTTAFGMFATGNQFCNASRNLIGGMQVGDVLSFYWAINWDANGGGKGFDLRNGSTTIFNVNNFNNATISTSNGTAFSTYGTNPMLVTVTRSTSSSYSFSMTARDGGATYNTTINSSSSINNLNFYIGNQNDGNGNRNMYINAFAFTKPNQYRSNSSGNWSDAATWQISSDGGVTWSTAITPPVSTMFSTITIRNNHTVSQNQNYSVGSNNNIVVESGGFLNMTGASGTFQFNTLFVSGTVSRNNINVYSGIITINSGGRYVHAVNGGSVPNCTWSSGSTFEITGITDATAFSSGGIQNYHHVVWNCTSQTSIFSFGGLTTINGNLSVQSTGASPSVSSGLYLTNSLPITATITGDLIISGGFFAPFGANTTNSSTLNISGNLTINGGTFDIYRPATNTGTINLLGNFSMSGGLLTKGGSGTGNFNFAKSGTQTYTKSSGTISNAINFNVNSGSTLDVGTNIIDGSTGTFTLSTSAGLITSNTAGITSTGATGSIQVGGVRTYSTGANYTFNGSSAQATGGGFTGANNLTINNGAGVTLSGNASFSGTLALNSGVFTVGSGNTITVSNGGVISRSNGSLAAGTGAGTFTFSGTGTITGTVGFNNVNIAGGVNFGTGSTINGILTINAGGFVNTNAPSYALNSTLRYNTGGTYGRGLEWNTISGSGYPNNVQISNNTILNLGNNAPSTARQCAGSLTVDSGSTLSLNSTPMSQALTIKGKFTNNGTTILSSQIGGDLKLEGDMDDNGTFTANGRAIFFEGSNNQTINSSTNPLDIDVMRIGKTSGEVILAQNLLVDETNDPIQFTTANSVLNLNGRTATFGKSGTPSTITMDSSSRIKGSTTSSLHILGTGPFGTLYFDQTSSGITNALNNLIINRTSGSVTLANPIAVAGSLTITDGNLNLGTVRHTANALTLGSTTQTTSSSYGGTSSPAENINNTYFAATSGYVNVGSCFDYSLTSTTATACLGSPATVTLSNTTAAQLPIGTYTVFYTLSGTNTGSGSGTMVVSTAGTGTFNTTNITNSGSTTITINFIRNGCVSAISANNTAIVTINSVQQASVSIDSSDVDNTICEGTSVTFTATPTNGGLTPSYQWKLNGNNVGTNSSTYTTSSLANDDEVSVVMTSNASPCLTDSPATSNAITTTVTPNTWIGSTGDWSNPSNWCGGVVPTSGQAIVISSGTPTLDVDFTVGSSGSLTLSGTASLIVAPNSNLVIEGAVDFGSRPVTFRSTQQGNGTLGTITGSLQGADNVTVERFFFGGSNRRTFRFMSSSVDAPGSIRLNWQEDGQSPSGYGTHITGNGGATNGFDVNSTNSASLFTFNNTANTWNAVTSTLSSGIAAGKAYRIFIRGDRTIDLLNTSSTVTPTALRTTGALRIGTVQSETLSQTPSGFSFVGNPYQSVLDADALFNDSDNANLNPDFFWIWDTTKANRGAYVTLAKNNGNWSNANNSQANRYIHPGQAFFVRNKSTLNGTASLTFKENHKADDNVNNSAHRIQANNTTVNPSLLVQLYSNALQDVVDGLFVFFSPDFSNAVDQNDAGKFTNPDEMMSVSSNNTLLSIEKRNLPLNNEFIQLKTQQYRTTAYILKVKAENFDPNITAFLYDQMNQTYSVIPNDDFLNYNFTVNATDTATTNPDRFQIVFTNPNLDTTVWNEQTVRIYPNPTTSKSFELSLPFNNADTTVSVWNAIGQKIWEGKVNTLNETIQLGQNTPTGTYMVKIESGNLKSVKKLIIQ